jgi:hypothetical protein
MLLQDAGLEVALQDRSSGYGGSSHPKPRAKKYETLRGTRSSPPPSTQRYENLRSTQSSPPPFTGTHNDTTASSPTFFLPPLDVTVRLKFYKVSITVLVKSLSFHDGR